MADRQRDRATPNGKHNTNPNHTKPTSKPTPASPPTGTPAYQAYPTTGFTYNFVGATPQYYGSNIPYAPGAFSTNPFQGGIIPRGNGNYGNPNTNPYGNNNPGPTTFTSQTFGPPPGAMGSPFPNLDFIGQQLGLWPQNYTTTTTPVMGTVQYQQHIQYQPALPNLNQSLLNTPLPPQQPYRFKDNTPRHLSRNVRNPKESKDAKDRKYPCPICSKEISREWMKQHMERVHNRPHKDKTPVLPKSPYNGGPLKCDQCSSSFADAKHLRDHQYKIHRPDSKYNRSRKPVEGGLPCPRGCDKRFENEYLLTRHMKENHPEVHEK
ncbi:uncharacterized protein GGS22DRAFT_195351 [Annulohypoxylon maeteangense]|uniref:uncharacterized protein n=1 Tax=Annulohypoxylon maeteangense TaxID=1927788 RepID=UPI00200760DD|nr:uncharacterized protein GGS22DRAFT_195351 [Annulohypoxylon maeteangense]KAI0883075.1 hypothetical protein GGS22DRAFT_195351 [Annulohypoxylon maeteangense]